MNTDKVATMLGALAGLMTLLAPAAANFGYPGAGMAAGALGAAALAALGYVTNKPSHPSVG
jgi:hypothetical protein